VFKRLYDKTVGLHEQLAFMRVHWPSFTSRVQGGILTSRGLLCPGGLCATYHVAISYAVGKAPEVRVLQPALRRRRNDEPIPHMYEQEHLCLFLPNTGEWEPESLIATTIVPWASLWLYFYEVWHATGEWLGELLGKFRTVELLTFLS
jgi:hypothetical protein